MVNHRVAMIGMSEGNGHPFSFSAIVNGYDDAALQRAGWPVIHEYVRRRDPTEFGVPGLTITHAWTQHPEVTRALAAACRIPHVATRLEELPEEVDAAIIARDDHEHHWELARPFLERGLPVFVDKPLTLDPAELGMWRRFVECGLVMSCSGMRYAIELDTVRATLESYGRLRLVRGVIVLSLEKYGIHLIDAVTNVIAARAVSVSPHAARHQSVAIELDDGCLFLLDALGRAPGTFRVEFFGEKQASSHDIVDNFSMFKRALWRFGDMVQNRKPPIPPAHTMDTIRLLIGCSQAWSEQRRVEIGDIRV